MQLGNEPTVCPALKLNFLTKSRSLEQLTGRIPTAEKIALMCTADDCFNVKPQFEKSDVVCSCLFFVNSYLRKTAILYIHFVNCWVFYKLGKVLVFSCFVGIFVNY